MAQQSHSASGFLDSLRAVDLAALAPYLDVLELPPETVLFDGGDAIKTVYFPHSGIVSLVVDLSTGQTIETGMVGRDGVVGGSSVIGGSKVSLNRAVVQVAGKASVLKMEPLRAVAEQSSALRTKLIQHEEFLLAQAQQSAACNVSHSLEERLSSWLLRCQDFLHSDDMPMTQEFLAGMLGVQRTSVTMAARMLQQAGLIRPPGMCLRVLQNTEGTRRPATGSASRILNCF